MADAPPDLVHLTLSGIQQSPGEQPVILSRCFPGKHTAGYTHLSDRRVVSVNGEPVLNLRQMYARIRKLHAAAERYISIEIFCVGGNAVIAIETATADAVLAETLEKYRIPAACSPDLLAEEAEA